MIVIGSLWSWGRWEGLCFRGAPGSRHYYDSGSMVLSGKIETALSDFNLALDCVRHARMFFGSPDLDLETARPGSFALILNEGMARDLRRDYERMTGMIIGPAPAFDRVIESIRTLEQQLNVTA